MKLSKKQYITITAYIIASFAILNVCLIVTHKIYDFMFIMPEASTTTVNVPRYDKTYTYNELVPEEIILQEITNLGTQFNFSENQMTKWIKIVRCEATCTKGQKANHNCELGKLTNLAQNKTSTAVGIGQYLIRTWYATESWKQFHKARTDYKSSLLEMALDLQAGEGYNKWKECFDKYNYTSF